MRAHTREGTNSSQWKRSCLWVGGDARRLSPYVALPKGMPKGMKRPRGAANETASGSAFEWLLSTAISPASFFADHWERKPLLAQLSKTAGDRYDTLATGPAGSICSSGVRQPLFGTAVLLDIARSHGPLELGRQLQVMRVGDHGRRESAEPPRDGLASAPWLEARLEEGFTVQLFQPQHWVDRLWALLAAMEAELGCLCGCSVYHTPAGCQGLAPHHDDVEVFILQTEGRKRWKLYPPLDGHALPSRPSPDLADEIIGECMLDVVLCPGDLLYMPRGVIHHAVSLEDASSTHLTLSTYQRHAWADLVGHMLPWTCLACKRSPRRLYFPTGRSHAAASSRACQLNLPRPPARATRAMPPGGR